MRRSGNQCLSYMKRRNPHKKTWVQYEKKQELPLFLTLHPIIEYQLIKQPYYCTIILRVLVALPDVSVTKYIPGIPTLSREINSVFMALGVADIAC